MELWPLPHSTIEVYIVIFVCPLAGKGTSMHSWCNLFVAAEDHQRCAFMQLSGVCSRCKGKCHHHNININTELLNVISQDNDIVEAHHCIATTDK